MSTNSTSQKVGITLAGLMSLASIPSVLTPTPDGETGPPFVVLVLATILGLVGAVAAVLAWRGNRGAMRVLSGAIIVNAVASLPAFFVDVPALIKLAVGVSLLLSVLAVVLMFTAARDSLVQPAMD